MRTLSARILLGFAALTIAFAGFAALLVLNLREVEDQASLILRGYVPLAMASAELRGAQDDLKTYLDQSLSDAMRASDVAAALKRLRAHRDSVLTEFASKVDSLRSLASSDGKAATEAVVQYERNAPLVIALKRMVEEAGAAYPPLVAAPPLHLPKESDPSFGAAYEALDSAHKAGFEALRTLRETEKTIAARVRDLHTDWQRRTLRIKDWLADNERTLGLWAAGFGVAGVVLGLIITGWVAMTLRSLQRLREGARRIAAGDYGKRIPETGPTEIADLAREFNSMGRAVEEREEEKLRAARLAMVGKMASHIAHEVRNPLASIGLNTELIEEELGNSEAAKEGRTLCRRIHAEVNRLTEVTETYLGLRGGEPKLGSESVNAIVGDLVGFVRHDLASKNVALATELDPEDPTGYVDANQIRQCLINLVRNAADAVSTKGGGRVVLRTRGATDRVEIAVEDDGTGITPDALPRLFDPFFSTKKGGTGLGLALTQQIIRDHGGEIHVASRVGRGTTFTLSVPVG